MKKIIILIFCVMLFLPAAAWAGFTAVADINVSGVTFGLTSAEMIIISGSASDSWSFNGGVFSVTNPGVFKVGSIDATVKSIVVNNGSADVVCAPNSVPGTSYVTLPTAAGIYTVEPSATADCCPVIAHAATYNSFPTCGVASCASGFNLSGGQCAAAGSGGGGGGLPPAAPIAPAKSPDNPLGIFQLLINSGASSTTDRTVSLKMFGGSDTVKMAVSNSANFSGVSSESFQNAKQWDLCAGSNVCPDGDYAVYAKFYNSAGVASPVVSAQIRLNSEAGKPIETIPTVPATPANLSNATSQIVEQTTLEEAKNLESLPKFINLSVANNKVYETITALAAGVLAADIKFTIAKFIQEGTPSAINLGAGERGGSIASFAAAFGRLPKTLTDWQDVIKIANGRWPTQRSAAAEARAKLNFKIIYLRDYNPSNIHDVAATMIMSYGLRPAQRNLKSEQAAIKSFRFIYRRSPVTAREWDAVRAIAYSGAKR